MYQAIGLPYLLRIILFANAAAAVALATDFWGLFPALPHLKAVSSSVLFTTALIYCVGQTPLFPWLCKLPLMWRVFPNIDGLYEAEISSNWPLVAGRAEGQVTSSTTPRVEQTLFRKVGTARIRARLLTIEMRLETDDGYLNSDTVVCTLKREPGEARPILSYIYKSAVPVPERTDSEQHFGAARIDIPNEKILTCLEGTYWTNRNWHKGLNTAGRIRLKRKMPSRLSPKRSG